MSFIIEDHVLRQQNTSLETGQPTNQAPGFCVWTLIPEHAQALVIENTLLDARFASWPSCFPAIRLTIHTLLDHS